MITEKIKKIISILCMMHLFSNAQQQTLYTQFMWNEYTINPAYTGALNYSPVQLTYRKQWQNFNGGPETFAFGGHTSINKKMGFGGQLFKDVMGGAITQTGFIVNYAYRVYFNNESRLSFGASAIVNQFAFDNTKINPLNTNDPSFQGGIQKNITPDIVFGVLYQFKQKLNIGISSSQLLQSQLKKLNTFSNSNNNLIRHYSAQLSYKFLINDKINLEPSFLFKTTQVTNVQMDVNVRAWYNNLVMLGFTYRHQDAMAALLAIKYKSMFIGYSYDMSNSDLKKYNKGSHEIILGYHFLNKRKDKNFELNIKNWISKLNRDTDFDGIKNRKDKCPDVFGPIENNGCPWLDKDKDSITDNIDKCPDVFGPIENKGCPWPDTDNDSITDNIDKCPDLPGTREDGGCPAKDTDHDGLPDKIDNCPKTFGEKTNDGCPIITENQKVIINAAINNLEFEYNSFNINKESDKTLNALAALLEEKPDLKLKISGHTDNNGSEEYNLKLSMMRSESVKDYLVKKGINATRFTLEFFGESKPLESNESSHGKEKNRRVEMKFMYD